MIAGWVLVAGFAVQAVSPEVVQHAQLGLEAQKQGRLSEAIAEFKRVTDLAPNLAAGFVNLGAAYMQNRDYANAIAPLKRAVQLNPDLQGAQQMLGYALLAQGYAAESIPHFEQAHVMDGLGVAQLKTGKLSEAIASLQRALAQHPNDPDLLYYLGRASGLLSKQVFDSLEAQHGNSARAHQALAENYAVLRRIPEAEKEYQDALRLRPDTPGIHLELGQLYASASRWQDAEQQFRAESRLQPGDAEAAYRLGDALLREGRVKEARVQLERADQLRPGMPETLYACGKAASLDGDVAEAEKDWLQVIANEPGGPFAAQAHFGLAGIYRKEGKTAQAEREMQDFRRLQAPGSEPQ